MKSLNTIFESHYSRGNQLDTEVSQFYWKMKRLVTDKWGQFKNIYNDELRQILIDFLKACGEGEYHTIFIKPVKIEFDYNIKGGYTPGLICGLWLNKKDAPIMFVDCLDGKPLFGVSIDDLFTGMFRLRNNVLVDNSCLYDLINKGDIAYTVSKSDCQSMRKSYVEKYMSEAGQVGEILKNQLKSGDYSAFEDTIKEILNSKGQKYSNGLRIPLKRTGNFWNCYISEISLVKNNVWITVYWQGDSTDGDKDLKLIDVLKKGKTVIKHRNEQFTVDAENINAMVEDIEAYLNEHK